MSKELCLVSTSGGLDSSLTLSILKLAGYENIVACYFNYGHRGGKAEEMAITSVTKELNIPLKIFNLEGLYKEMDLESVSMLANKNAEIITGTAKGLKTVAAWHAGRNMMFLTTMASFAEVEVMKHGYEKVYLLGGFLNLSESGCFVDCDQNLVLDSNNKLVRATNLNVGDKILSFNFENKKIESSEIKQKFISKHDVTYRVILTFDEGAVHSKKTMLLSKEHPIWIRGKGWVETQNLAINDMCYSIRECKMSDRTSHSTAYKTVEFRQRMSKLHKGRVRSQKTKDKISEALTGHKKTEEHCHNISQSLMGKMVGEKNPMFGHIRSNENECWCGKMHKTPTYEWHSENSKNMWKNPEYRNKVIDGCTEFWNSDKSIEARKKLSENQKQHVIDYILENGQHWNQTVEMRKRLSEATSLAIKEGRINPSKCFQDHPNKTEKRLLDLFEEKNIPLRFVGDGQIWITSCGKHMNPDFINIPQKKIVEYYGGMGFFHTEEEIEQRHIQYEKVGWQHLAIKEYDLKNMDLVMEKVYNFMLDVHNGWLVEKIEVISAEQEMVNFHCEPNNNFFINKILTHNTYPDNSEYFLNSALEFFKYGTLIGKRIQPLYCLSNLMKHELFVLIRDLNLKNVYRWTISCDRPMVESGHNDHQLINTPHANPFKQIACNCMKGGVPACGSGLLSYWASKMVGMDDMTIRNFCEVNDPGYEAYIPEHLKQNFNKTPNVMDIINRILLPEDRLDILRGIIEVEEHLKYIEKVRES